MLGIEKKSLQNFWFDIEPFSRIFIFYSELNKLLKIHAVFP